MVTLTIVLLQLYDNIENVDVPMGQCSRAVASLFKLKYILVSHYFSKPH